jgi:hypothetical protein
MRNRGSDYGTGCDFPSDVIEVAAVQALASMTNEGKADTTD